MLYQRQETLLPPPSRPARPSHLHHHRCSARCRGRYIAWFVGAGVRESWVLRVRGELGRHFYMHSLLFETVVLEFVGEEGMLFLLGWMAG